MKIEQIELGNFRKLQSVHVGISEQKTVFVGANNSGKTSAMVALRCFLLERERTKFSLNDFTLSYWPAIEEMGRSWEEAKAAAQELPEPDWAPFLPFLDVWLVVEKSEAHFVQKLIPTLDWDGGRLGVRLRLEPRDSEQLQKDFLAAREDAKAIEAADKGGDGAASGEGASSAIILWPRSLTEYLQRRFSSQFTVRAYVLDPAKLAAPEHGLAKPQAITCDAVPIEGEAFKGLIRIDEIPAQRGFGQLDGPLDPDDDGPAVRASATRKLSEQLRRYWNRHLDPYDSPDAKDLEALRAIEQAQKAFDDRLREGFGEALNEVEGLGYPGVTDPRLKIATRLKPVDGLNHEAAVQYMIQVLDGESAIDLNLPEDSNGLGYQNLISMIFRLMSARDAWMRVGKAASKSEAESDTLIPPLHLVLIEEPEAYLHTQVQQVFIRQAYKILRNHEELRNSKSALTTQMIVSTHSSHLAHECDFDSLRYFRRLPAATKGVPISSVVDLGSAFGTDVETKRFVTRYVKVTHCDLFFADAAVLVEGPAERVLVPFFIRHQPDLQDLQECYVTWLEIGGSHAHRLRSLIEQLGLTTLIITDLDATDADNKSVAPVRGATQKSRNATLKTWCPKQDDLDALLDLKPESKVAEYRETNFSIRVAYQCPIVVEFKGTKGEFVSNTLEDALAAQNLNLFSSGDGKGLFAKFKAAIDGSSTIAELQAKLFEELKAGGKAEFALDLLELENPAALQPPLYIREGLVWLAGQLRKVQKELGVALPLQEAPEKSAKDS
ncbi:MAG: AAA family ATPase [Nitratireductor sp.]|nr:AAA family ATPase [Nitratireductor sp.]